MINKFELDVSAIGQFLDHAAEELPRFLKVSNRISQLGGIPDTDPPGSRRQQ